MSYRILLLAKQVPDTRNVGKDAMKSDGTVNRVALPAIFNPEDLNALEFALRVKDQRKDAEVIIITMGPPRAADIIREGMYRGADKGVLITDRKFAGSDTLATSYAISLAVKKLAPFDMVVAGRQAIDGDTAQVGPQVAEKLNIPQITYAEEFLGFMKNKIQVKRRLERGVEILEAEGPVLITVHSSAADCRVRNAKRVMKYKYARTEIELQEAAEDYIEMLESRPYLQIKQWSVTDLKADVSLLGLSGSPTKVKKIENVVFTHKDSTTLSSSDADINKLVKSLISSHVIG
ncbi:MAG: electron transfer flavoprotein beta subunit/FixA family protein [Bacteroidetes bacterium]|nr:MAG: electron transfer flavoprotein beta subunit/FixA family protein [Bacteroidota bacterium]